MFASSKLVATAGSSQPGLAQRPHSSLEGLFRGVNLFELKVTMGCNLTCTYCNMDAQKSTARRMSLSLYQDAIEFLVKSSPNPSLNIEFHGGEPLLLSDAWYQEAVTTGRRLAKEHGKSLRFKMVTNGVLLSESRLGHLSNLGIGMCLSLDGPPALNDEHRGGGSLVEDAVRRLHEWGVPYGMLTVITDATAYRMTEVLDYFTEIGIKRTQSAFVNPQGRALQLAPLSRAAKMAAVEAIITHMAETNCAVRGTSMERHMGRYIQGREANPALSCSEKECMAGRTMLAMDPGGDLFACATDMVNHRLGNLYEGADKYNDRTLARLHEKDSWYERCTDCEARSICDFNCPTSHHNDLQYRDDECAHTKELYTFLECNEDKLAAIGSALAVIEREREEKRRLAENKNPGPRRHHLPVLNSPKPDEPNLVASEGPDMKYTEEEIQALQQKISAAGLTDREKQILADAVGGGGKGGDLTDEELEAVSGGAGRNLAKSLGLKRMSLGGFGKFASADWNNSATVPDEQPWKNSAVVDFD